VPCPRPRSVQELAPSEKAGGCWGRADATGVLTANIWAADHVLADAGITDVDAEFQQLTVDAWRAPHRVLAAHLAYQLADVFRNARRPGLAVTDLPRPEQPEALPMPGNHGLRFTITRAKRQSPQTLRGQAQKNRPAAVSFRRFFAERWSTPI
jgi:hypothetical protein